MRAYDLFFFAALFFVFGTILGGLGVSPALSLIFASASAAALFAFKVRTVAALAIAAFLFAGNFYYSVHDYAYHAKVGALEESSAFEGIVISEPRRRVNSQTAIVKVTESNAGRASGARVSVLLPPYPEFFYGDVVLVSGKVNPPPDDSYGKYLAKEGVHGTVSYPSVELVGKNPNAAFAALYAIRDRIKDAVNREFTARQSAFLSGVLLGDRDEFSPEFLEKLSISGTMHLTALSGLHMAIIIFVALAVFLFIFRGRRRYALAATLFIVVAFVAMTGFKVSAIRASLMAFIAGFAEQAGRFYGPRNAIALAALLITAANPKAPVFDLGFQLSFAATISIIYFAPVLRRLQFFGKDSFLGWRGILAITIAAQIGVAPISIMAFGNFSFSALPANVAILAVMPVLMVLGFTTAFAAMVSGPLASVLAKPTAALLDYSAGVVEIFSSASVPFNPSIGLAAAAAYYAVLIFVSARYAPAAKNQPKKSRERMHISLN